MTKIKKIKYIFSKLNFLEKCFLDLFLLYRNILHWNISKIIIFLYTILLAIVSVIPFFVIYLISTFFTWDSFLLFLNNVIYWVWFTGLYENIMYLLISIIFIIFFFYSNILLIDINNTYLKYNKKPFKWKHIEFSKKIFFNYIRIINYFKLTILNIMILLLPIVWFFIIIALLYFWFWSTEWVNNLLLWWELNSFSIISLIVLTISWIIFFILLYRLLFSYFIFTDSKYYDAKQDVYYYIKKWFKKTKWKLQFVKLTSIFILLAVIFLPISFLENKLLKTSKDINMYQSLSSFSDDKIEQLPNTTQYYIQWLKLQYWGFSDDKILLKKNMNNLWIILYNIFNFILLYGIFTMILTSFYRRNLLK
jgi:hypothetical protein